MEHQLTEQESFGEAGLEREIGRPRAEWTVEDLAHMFRQGKARGLSLMHVGGDGWLKRLDFVPRDESQLRRICEAGDVRTAQTCFPDPAYLSVLRTSSCAPGSSQDSSIRSPRFRRWS